MSSIKDPREKKAVSFERDHRIHPLAGDKSFRGVWKRKKRRLVGIERSSAKLFLRSQGEEEPSNPPQNAKGKRLRKLGVVNLKRAIDIAKRDRQKRFSRFEYSSMRFERPAR